MRSLTLRSHSSTSASAHADANLAVRPRNGHSAAYVRAQFEALYQRYANQVYRYLLARVGNTHDAQELTSETFIAAFEGLEHYQEQGKAAAWLIRIAKHKAVDHFRAQSKTVSLDAVAELSHPAPLPDETIATRLQWEQVSRALRALSPDRAEALTLRVLAGLSVAEVAAVMGKNEAAVRMLVSRALHDLRERLAWTLEVAV
jgi:RNA polymerase sigma-70 factor (ECF subfamily)